MRSEYAKAGVDFDKEHSVVEIFKKLFHSTRENIKDLKARGFELPKEIGYFADGIDIHLEKLQKRLGKKVRVLKAADGAGTKPLVHQLYRMIGGKNEDALSSVGIDTIAMVANDMLCTGARTVLITDYIAWTDPNVEIARDLARGLFKGSIDARAVIIGGENASLREMIKGVPPPGMQGYINGVGLSLKKQSDQEKPIEELFKNIEKYFIVKQGKGYDICADALGIIFSPSVAKRLEGKSIKEGDIIIGIRSSGIHCNGISLARKKLIYYPPMGWFGEFHPEAEVDEFGGKTALEEILTPTIIYCPLLDFIDEADYVKAVINITGEGVRNLFRVLGDKYGADLDFSSVEKPHEIFLMLQKLGNVPTKEMYEDFNMGWGLYVIVGKNHCEEALFRIMQRGFFDADILGEITKKEGIIRLNAYNNEEITYKR